MDSQTIIRMKRSFDTFRFESDVLGYALKVQAPGQLSVCQSSEDYSVLRLIPTLSRMSALFIGGCFLHTRCGASELSVSRVTFCIDRLLLKTTRSCLTVERECELSVSHHCTGPKEQKQLQVRKMAG